VAGSAPHIGVLALQGDFEAHQRAIAEAGAHAFPVRTGDELSSAAGLIIPGGESTTMLKLLDAMSMFEPLRQFGLRRPILGTCAGAILLASDVLNPAQKSLGLMDITVERNAYGRQVHSQVTQLEWEGEPIEAVFIRAPIIRRTGKNVLVLIRHQGDPVVVEEGLHMAATFHPELTAGRHLQRRFLEKVEQCPM
jgi:5'-phosphate synthase pdxT subunit